MNQTSRGEGGGLRTTSWPDGEAGTPGRRGESHSPPYARKEGAPLSPGASPGYGQQGATIFPQPSRAAGSSPHGVLRREQPTPKFKHSWKSKQLILRRVTSARLRHISERLSKLSDMQAISTNSCTTGARTTE